MDQEWNEPLRLITTRKFERDVRRVKSRQKDLGKLWLLVDRLRQRDRLEPRHRVHRLEAPWRGSWECHIEPDWLLIWRVQDDRITLVRTGTHADLFG